MDETFFTYDGTGITLNVPTPEGLKTVALFGLVALAIAVVLAGIRFWQNKPAWMKDLRIHSNTGLNAGAWILLTVFGALYVCVFVVLVGGLIWALSHVPDIIDGALYANDPSEARWLLASLAALTAVTSAAVALPFTILKTIYNRRQTNVAEQNHVTDQINKAVENLGATRQVGEDLVPNIHVRIGGLVTLERIARTNRTVYLELMEVIAAYLVENLPETFRPKEIVELRADLARCMQLISNRTDKDIEFEKSQGWRMNLDGAKFGAKVLEKVKFRNVSLDQADFSYAVLIEVMFANVAGRFQSFDLSSLKSVSFTEMDLTGSTFKFSTMTDVCFNLARPFVSPIDQFECAVLKDMEFPQFSVSNNLTKFAEVIFADRSVTTGPEFERPEIWPDTILKFTFGKEYIRWREYIDYHARREEFLTEIGFDARVSKG